jgi:endoglucanase
VVEAGKRGILIMLDQHRLDPERGISDLWCVGHPVMDECIYTRLSTTPTQTKPPRMHARRRYDVDYEEPVVLRSWDIIVGRYKRHWNVFALDLKNENHGPCSWGSGEAFTCWKAASERIMRHIAATHPDFTGLFFVGGIWGGGGHWCVSVVCRVSDVVDQCQKTYR